MRKGDEPSEMLVRQKICRLEICFPEGKSPSIGKAIRIASESENYKIDMEGRCAFHTATFDITDAARAEKALELSRLAFGWKGVSMKVNSGLLPTSFGTYMWTMDILKCYVLSLKIKEKKAYCWSVDMMCLDRGTKFERFLVYYPCSHITVRRHRIDYRLPVSFRDQYEAIATKAGIGWCPSLELDDAISATIRANGFDDREEMWKRAKISLPSEPPQI
jgi:hypothetical protein